jgi:hypothetical protein
MKNGSVLVFTVRATADLYQLAYGGTLIDKNILTEIQNMNKV